jgi:hypothetical protein
MTGSSGERTGHCRRVGSTYPNRTAGNVRQTAMEPTPALAWLDLHAARTLHGCNARARSADPGCGSLPKRHSSVKVRRHSSSGIGWSRTW